jgi:hypothetical protein
MRIEREKGNWQLKNFRSFARTKSNTDRPMYKGANNFITDKTELKPLEQELIQVLLLQVASFRRVINLRIVTEYDHGKRKKKKRKEKEIINALYCTRS